MTTDKTPEELNEEAAALEARANALRFQAKQKRNQQTIIGGAIQEPRLNKQAKPDWLDEKAKERETLLKNKELSGD